MRRLAAATVTALLSAAALTAGTAGAQGATATHFPHHTSPHRTYHHRFTVRLLGSLHLKRVDTMNGKSSVAYLVCTSTMKRGAAPVIHGSGGLKDATSACAELAAVHGNLDSLSVHPAWLPPALEAPVEVTAAGTWEGAKVSWTHRYTNGGCLTKATGDVFAF